MLRASTSGLRDHHDKSRRIFWIFHRRLQPVLATYVLLGAGSSRGPFRPIRDSMANWWALGPATLAKGAITRAYGPFSFTVATSRGFSTSTQIITPSEAPPSVDTTIHIPSMEQTACTRTTETDSFQIDHDVSQTASRRVNTSENTFSMLSDNIDADILTVSSSDNDAAFLLDIIATTTSAHNAWDAYEHLRRLDLFASYIPTPHLHRLSRLLSQTKPRTRSLYLRLLSVLSDLHRRGSPIQLWQWNALIDCAGKGWRKTRLEDFKNALDVFEDMVAQRHPGATFSEDNTYEPTKQPSSDQTIVPDIVTFTTLVNIAGRTKEERAVRHAMSLLKRSELVPNRITYLSLIRYFTRTRQLSFVRDTLSIMKDKGEDLGIDGVNACIWAYGYNGRLDVASTIYSIIRHPYLPENQAAGVMEAIRHLSATEGLDIPSGLVPDAVTYHTLIQVYAYRGDFDRCIQTFIDMISFPDNVKIIADREQVTSLTDAGIGSPTLAAYRSIFLGFSRHGQLSPSRTERVATTGEPSPWNEANLYTLFHSFLQLPDDVKPSARTIYWLLEGFRSTIGQPNSPRRCFKLRHIFERLVARFGGGWKGRLEDFRKEIYKW